MIVNIRILSKIADIKWCLLLGKIKLFSDILHGKSQLQFLFDESEFIVRSWNSGWCTVHILNHYLTSEWNLSNWQNDGLYMKI